MEVKVRYSTVKPAFGVFPVKKAKVDTITYNTYVMGDNYPATIYLDAASVRSEKTGSNIPSEMFKMILHELKKNNAIDRVAYNTRKM
jgi:hypothetical protein